MRIAFGDESFVERNGVGVYAIGLVHVSPDGLEEARSLALSLVEKGKRRIHYHDVLLARREELVERIQRGPWLASAWVTYAGSRQQERARRVLLRHASYGRPSESWTLESRGPIQDRRDQRLFATVFTTGIRNPVHLTHALPSTEPLLWIADVVASASAGSLARGLPAPFQVQHCER
jgi:hypothetical protein